KAIFVVLLAAVLMIAEWILLVAGTRLDEMIVGAASVLASGAFLFVAHRTSALHTDFRLSDIAKGWRIPWYVVTDLFVITMVLFKDLFGIEKAKSIFRVCGFKTGKRDPVLVARRVLAIAYTSASPNTIVLGIDYTCSRMLFHQLKRTPLLKMTNDLGSNS
ncbi:MAG TPA: hypothetical protein VE195_11150, partial [Acidobacteriaceae bacterium]|nr:hypothetical protein [Acidobacteriaceae bacterium]